MSQLLIQRHTPFNTFTSVSSPRSLAHVANPSVRLSLGINHQRPSSAPSHLKAKADHWKGCVHPTSLLCESCDLGLPKTKTTQRTWHLVTKFYKQVLIMHGCETQHFPASSAFHQTSNPIYPCCVSFLWTSNHHPWEYPEMPTMSAFSMDKSSDGSVWMFHIRTWKPLRAMAGNQ